MEIDGADLVKRPAVFLDRDGTINVDTGYVCTIEELHLIPGVAKAIGDLKRAGCSIIVVTNQSAIGRGYATAEQVENTNRELQRQLRAEDQEALLDRVL